MKSTAEIAERIFQKKRDLSEELIELTKEQQLTKEQKQDKKVKIEYLKWVWAKMLLIKKKRSFKWNKEKQNVCGAINHILKR